MPGLPASLSVDSTWRTIERLVGEVAVWTQEEIPVETFYGRLADQLLKAVAADAVIVWIPNDAGHLHALIDRSPVERGPGPNGSHPGDTQCPDSVMRAWQAKSDRRQAADPEFPDESTIFVRILCQQRPVALLQVQLSPALAASALQASRSLVSAVAELAGDYHRNRLVDQLEQQLRAEARSRAYANELVRHVTVAEVAYTIANEGAARADCDQVSVLVADGRDACRAVAVTGVDRLERRSRRVKLLEQAASLATRFRQAVWFPDPDTPYPPQVQQCLQPLLDETDTRQIGLVPLYDSATHPEQVWEREEDTTVPHARVIGVLVVEDRAARWPASEFQRRARALADESHAALARAVQWERIPGARWLWRLARRKPAARSRVWWGLAAAALVLLSVPWFVRVPLRLPADGTLQPVRRQHLFAPEDAVVHRVAVRHGEQVLQDQVLLELTRPELDLELTRCLGELQVSRRQLQSAKAQRYATPTDSDVPPHSAERLAAEEQQHEQRIAALTRQLELLQARRDDLKVTSPFPGQVLTWDTERLLAARPVRAGQRLLSVADPQGPWHLELRMRDRDVFELLQSLEEPLMTGDASGTDGVSPSARRVAFTLATNPGVTYRGQVVEIGRRSESLDAGPPTVPVVVRVDPRQVRPLRAGSEVTARIDCGRRLLGYVWLRDAWHTLLRAVY